MGLRRCTGASHEQAADAHASASATRSPVPSPPSACPLSRSTFSPTRAAIFRSPLPRRRNVVVSTTSARRQGTPTYARRACAHARMDDGLSRMVLAGRDSPPPSPAPTTHSEPRYTSPQPAHASLALTSGCTAPPRSIHARRGRGLPAHVLMRLGVGQATRGASRAPARSALV